MKLSSISKVTAGLTACCISQAFGGGFYSSEFGTPGSLGTGGAGNTTNNVDADSSFTNPAGMTGLEQDVILTGLQLLLPAIEFDNWATREQSPCPTPPGGGCIIIRRSMMIKLKVTGMTCEHCENAVEKALAGVAGVDQVVEVNREHNVAVVEGQAEEGALLAAVREEGYEAELAQ